MTRVQASCLVLSIAISCLGWVLLGRRVLLFIRFYRSGQPDSSRAGNPRRRTAIVAQEFLGHTRLTGKPVVAVAHWLVAVGFFILVTTLVSAFLQLAFGADYVLPGLGRFQPYEWVVEVLAAGGLVAILTLILIRQGSNPRGDATQRRRSRFFGSRHWQAYFVEMVVLTVVLCVLVLRALEAVLAEKHATGGVALGHFPITGWASPLLNDLSVSTLTNMVYVVATVKIVASFSWMIVVASLPGMGVAWHRFLAFVNIWFKREPTGRAALGEVRPMLSAGAPVDFENLDSIPEDAPLGIGRAEDFTWKDLLDFSTCTECGRCQSQCPAWNTAKPLSPKLLVMAMRQHTLARAPYLRAADDESDQDLLVGSTAYDPGDPTGAYLPEGPGGVIDPDVLWSCTTCGACVDQCPVDIEHVDHIVDLRRYQMLTEAAFPDELGPVFRSLEGRGNPYGLDAHARTAWADDLPFPVPVLGRDLDDAADVDYVLWVGCAAAYEDRSGATVRALAELLHVAEVSFAVLGDDEVCTGDPARRAGNELLFQLLAAQNISALTQAQATNIVVTCAHCFNTLANEYPRFNGSFHVVHHTQLLNRLVKAGRLVPVLRPGDDRPDNPNPTTDTAATTRVTYHDPCYLGRHNGIYLPPRELLEALPGVELKEMPRSGRMSFCCGGGGARAWVKESLGTRINLARTSEALETGAERIAISCPFCRTMLSDGLAALPQSGRDVEVVDVAQMLLAAIRRP